MHPCKLVLHFAAFFRPFLLNQGQLSLLGPCYCLALLQVKAPAFSLSL